MTLILLLLTFVALTVAAGAAVVVSRASAGHDLELDLTEAARSERPVVLVDDSAPSMPATPIEEPAHAVAA